MMKWTKDLTLQFIELYRERELLWNPKHSRHFNKLCKSEAWEEIASQLGVNSEKCKQKMTILLSSLRRERLKIKKSRLDGKGEDDIYKSSWFAFDSLSFLFYRNNFKNDTSAMHTNKEENISMGRLATEEIKVEEQEIEHPVDALTEMLEASASRLTNENFQLEANANVGVDRDDDECHIFTKFIAKKMEKYSSKTKSSVQQAIMNILFNADNGYYDQDTCAVYPPNPQHI